MPLTAKMYCAEITTTGGGTWLPLCMAHDRMRAWPPADEDLDPGTVMGHSRSECEDCRDLAAEINTRRAEATSEYVRAESMWLVHLPGQGGEEVKLTAVIGDDPDDPNRAWAVATPSGTLEMHIANPEAWGFFEAGAEYLVRITKHQPNKARTGESEGERPRLARARKMALPPLPPLPPSSA